VGNTGIYVLTHGADSPEALQGTGGSPAATGPWRRPVCGTDHVQRFIYARRADAPDRLAGQYELLQRIIEGADATLNRDSLASGGGNADYNVLCDESGRPLIQEMETDGTDFSSVLAAARAAGFNTPRTDNTIFLDAEDFASCAIANFFPDERPGEINRSTIAAGFAVIRRDCWRTLAPMHENGHNQGAVQANAPHSTGGDHCWQESDVMCYSPDGGDQHQEGTVLSCGQYDVFDCQFDDYFDASTEPDEYLASNWNIGSPANPFLVRDRLRPESYSTHTLKQGRRINPDVAAAANHFHNYGFSVPRGARRLKVTLNRPACAPSCAYSLDLYVRRGSRPTRSRFNCRYRGSIRTQTCAFGRPKSGRWYAGVYTSRGGGGGPYSIKMTYSK
jgi:hypothetical protein